MVALDKEYIILNEIEINSSITQRELSKKTQLSLGSVNFVISKMVQDGFIKLKQIPMNRVIYMLTPKGITEKAKKTREYIKYHYNFIQRTKDIIESILRETVNEKKELYIVVENDEISQLLKLAAQNVSGCYLTDISNYPKDKMLIAANNELYQSIYSLGYEVANILEKI